MSIEYTYKIVKVDAEARCMEIVYTAEGRQTMQIGARLPYVGESLEAIVDMYSPVAHWLEQERQVVLPQVGVRGTISPTPTEAPTPPTNTLVINEVLV
jgi:hypothetical protein